MIKAILHVQIAVAKDKEMETIHFYRDVLGLKEIPKPEMLRKNGGAWFELGLQQFHIAPEEFNSESKRHVCFLVENIEAAREMFLSKGIEVTEDNQPIQNRKRFYFRDPAGNRMELAEITYENA
jgi:catechol 2,3-dioxygenase-like lactoylglutathione lyase family enzyme